MTWKFVLEEDKGHLSQINKGLRSILALCFLLTLRSHSNGYILVFCSWLMCAPLYSSLLPAQALSDADFEAAT
jgi:hypothetical protein